MSASEECDLIGEHEYLRLEERSDLKSEYVNGVVHAMSGAAGGHNQVAMNLSVPIGSRLRGKPCTAYTSDMKVRIVTQNGVRFYYPDLSVNCPAVEPGDIYLETPTMVAEVLSPSTRRQDLTEKKDAYLSIPSLQNYLIVEPARCRVTHYFRNAMATFEMETLTSMDTTIDLSSLKIEIPLDEVYEGLELPRK